MVVCEVVAGSLRHFRTIIEWLSLCYSCLITVCMVAACLLPNVCLLAASVCMVAWLLLCHSMVLASVLLGSRMAFALVIAWYSLVRACFLHGCWSDL